FLGIKPLSPRGAPSKEGIGGNSQSAKDQLTDYYIPVILICQEPVPPLLTRRPGKAYNKFSFGCCEIKSVGNGLSFLEKQ
ncbi:MAG: hypothetical protein WC919_04505, partial [Candidatus Paceibacterota bacterium]